MKKRNLSWSILWLAVLFALLARFIYLGKIPWGLYWDEVAMYVDLKALLATGRDMHGLPWHQLIFPSYGDYKAPIYLWFAWLSAKILGLSTFSLRLPSALAGVSTALISGLIAVKLLAWRQTKASKKLHSWLFLSTVLVVSFSPWSFLFSRTAFEAHLSQFFLALAVYLLLLVKIKDKWKSWWLIPSILIGVLSIYTYYSTRFIWPVLLLVILLLKSKQLLKDKKNKNKKVLIGAVSISLTIFSLVVTFLLLLPLEKSPFYQASQQFRFSTSSIIDAKQTTSRVLMSNRYRQLAGNTAIDRLFFHRDLFLLGDLAKHVSANISLNSLFLKGDSNLRHSTGVQGLFLLSFLPFFFIGLYHLAKNNPPTLTLLILWWLAAVIPASVPNEVPHALRSLNALVPLSIILGFGLAASFVYLQQWQSNRRIHVLNLGLAFILMTNFTIFINYYFKHYPLQSATSWQVGYQELAQLIYQHRQNHQPVVVLEPEERFYLWLMAFGPYHGSEFASWPEKHFLKTGFDEIEFERPKIVATKLKRTRKPFLLAGNEESVLNLIVKQRLNHSLCFLSKTGNEGAIKPIVCMINSKLD